MHTYCAFFARTFCVMIIMMDIFTQDKLVMKKLGKNIAQVRKKHGLTQERLAESTNLSRRAIQSIEGGERWPRPSTLTVIARVLKTPLNTLFKDIR